MNMPRGSQPVSGAFAVAVSEEIRVAMARHRFTAKGLAIAAGLSPSYVTKRLRNEASFTLNDVEAICAAMGEDLHGLMRAVFKVN